MDMVKCQSTFPGMGDAQQLGERRPQDHMDDHAHASNGHVDQGTDVV